MSFHFLINCSSSSLSSPHPPIPFWWSPSFPQVVLFFCICIYFMCMYLSKYAPTMCAQEPSELRRGIGIPWNWSFRWLRAAMWGLGTEPSSSARAVSSLNCLYVACTPLSPPLEISSSSWSLSSLITPTCVHPSNTGTYASVQTPHLTRKTTQNICLPSLTYFD